MKYADKPECGATTEGPIVKDRGRSRPLWRDRCHRKVREAGMRCWQHGGPRVTTPTTDPNGESHVC